MDKIIKGIEVESKEIQLKKVNTDSINWLVYFLDEITHEKWVKEYPNSEYHGGGSPQLRLIDKFPWE
jgi:hypothetical protein